MTIGNHPAFPRQKRRFAARIHEFLPRFWRAECFLESHDQSSSAVKTGAIKPNKAEPKNRPNSLIRHRGMARPAVPMADLFFAEEVSVGQLEKGVIMVRTLCIVGVVILVGLIAAVVLLHRAGKEIDASMDFDPERL